MGIGFSLGANVLTRYLAEEGDNSRFISGCVLGCVSRLISVGAHSTHLQFVHISRGICNRTIKSTIHISSMQSDPNSVPSLTNADSCRHPSDVYFIPKEWAPTYKML